MAFCGQCGYKLSPGNTRCPRCGTAIEPDQFVEEPHLFDPTMVSPHLVRGAPATPKPETQPPPGYAFAPVYPQQPLVLHSPESGAGSQAEPTTSLRARGGASTVPPHSASLHPPYVAAPLPARRPRAGLLITLFILVLVLVAATVLVARSGLLQGISGTWAEATPQVSPAPTLTATDHARSLLQQYYTDINRRDYQDAYNLWGTAFQRATSYTSFASGYSHTGHDDITIRQLTPASNDTITAGITIVAQENSPNGQVNSTYAGTYVIGQEHGTWKLLSGTFNKINS